MTSMNDETKFELSDFEHISTKEIARGQFVTLSEYTYKDGHQGKKSWEVAGRSYRPLGSDVDCVSTLPVLRRLLKYDCVILVKQYRPALKAFTLELPAGLVDLDEKTEETALRELKEETGYIGTSVKHISPVTALDPGLSDSTMKIVTVEIDGDNAMNHYPKQCSNDTDITERIDVLHIPVSELLDRINDYSEQGVIVDSRVYTFAIGMAMGAKLIIPKMKK